MKLLQDRKTQKELLIKSHIATSPFFDIKNYQELLALKKGTNLPLVLKARKNGYDGKGTYILKKWDDLKVKKFLAKQKEGVIAEDFIPFKRELALSICRSRNKDIIFFPLVESKQEAFCCTWVMGPTHHQQLSLLKTKLKNFVINNDYFGFLTFELFDTGKKLIVNEIAPRVHNSGHYSMDALDESQFSAHLKAIIGAKLSDPQLLCQGFAMYNLLGKSTNQPTWQLSPGVKLHWYGKEENYMGRKMGHLNAIADGPNQALNKVKRAIKEFKL
jgi:5-(carboxyamino)imidazole ribonucleotide synthase